MAALCLLLCLLPCLFLCLFGSLQYLLLNITSPTPETSSRFPVNIPGCEFAGPCPVAPRGVLPHVGYFSCCEQHTQDPTHAASLLTALNPLSPPYISLSLSLICSLLIRMSLHIISYLSLVLVISHDLRERAADSLPLKCLCAHRSCRGARPPRDPRPLCIRSHGCCRPPSTRDHPTRHALILRMFSQHIHVTLFNGRYVTLYTFQI